LGRGTSGGVGLPDVVSGGHLWREVSARSYEGACALTQTDSLFCWGTNLQGTLGDSTVDSTNVPIAVRPELAFQSVDAGLSIVCARTAAGAVFCWGEATWGRTPTQVTLPQAATVVSAGGTHACALLADSTAYCWGDGTVGQLGDGTFTPLAPTPVAVSGNLKFLSISTALGRTCGITSDQLVYCWGSHNGDGTSNVSSVPVRVAWQP
jgi:alpha-tubulin suppressor-like RCC1 family protein